MKFNQKGKVADMKNMKSITEIYNILAPIEGHTLARETVLAILDSALREFPNAEIDPIELNLKLEIIAKEFKSASKKDVA